MIALEALLGACVGPNFHRPAPPMVERYVPQLLQPAAAEGADSAGSAQRFLLQQEVPKNWWMLFGSRELDALVQEALRANPDVTTAQAALRQAMEKTAAQRGSYFPTIQGAFAASRNRDATGVVQPTLQSGSPLYSLFTPQVTVSYLPDIFGVNRRAVESLDAQAEASRFQLDATYLTLAANVVTTAIEEAALRAQIAATERAIALGRESLMVLRREVALGAIAEVNVYAQEAALAQVEATLPPLNKRWFESQDQLAVLTGHFPAAFTPPRLQLGQLTLPMDLPVGVPSQLVERRPDVRAAEAELHSATAQVGVAMADLLPQVTLTGDLGSTATLLSDLFKPGTGFWSLGADVSGALFAGGSLIHRKRAADAALDQAASRYRGAVLTAFQDVADALHSLDTDGQMLTAASHAKDAAEKNLGVSRHQSELGSVGYLAILDAEQACQQAMIAWLQAQSNRYMDTAAVFQALGGAISPVTITADRPHL